MKLINIIILFIILSSASIAITVTTIQNPDTRKRDFISTGNYSGDVGEFDNLTVNNKLAVGGLSYFMDNINGTNISLSGKSNQIVLDSDASGFNAPTIITSASGVAQTAIVRTPIATSTLATIGLTETITGTKTFTANNHHDGNNTYTGQEIHTPTHATLVDHTIHYQSKYMILDTEGGIELDNLTTITGGTPGAILILSTKQDDHDIDIYDDEVNINVGSSTRSMNRMRDKMMLIYDGQISQWTELSWANN